MDDNRIYYTVYCTTNLVNGKIYIGVHKTTDIYDSYLGSGRNLIKAIRKYGRENFDKSVLYAFDTSEEAYEKEKELLCVEILKSDSAYNISEGGLGNSDRNGWTEDTRKKLSDWKRNDEKSIEHCRKLMADPKIRKKLSESHKKSEKVRKNLERLHSIGHDAKTREKMSISQKTSKKAVAARKKWQSNPKSKEQLKRLHDSMRGKPKSEEHKRKITLAHQGKKSHNAVLNDEIVIIARKLYSNGIMTAEELSGIFGVGRKTMKEAVGNKTWKHLQTFPQKQLKRGKCPQGKYCKSSKLSEETVLAIRKMHRETGYGCQRLANVFGINNGTIEHIIKYHTWKHLP